MTLASRPVPRIDHPDELERLVQQIVREVDPVATEPSAAAVASWIDLLDGLKAGFEQWLEAAKPSDGTP